MTGALLLKILGPQRFQTVSPWGVWAGLSALIGIGLLSIAVAVGSLFVLSLVVPGSTADLYSCILQSGGSRSADCSVWLLGLSGLWGIALAAGFYGLARVRSSGTPQNVLLIRSSGLLWWQYIAILAGMLAVLYFSEIAISFISGASQNDLEQGLDLLKLVAKQGGIIQWIVLLLVVAVIAPISEEFAFRGFMFTTLVKTPLGLLGAAVVTSAAWTSLHYSYTWQILLVLFIFGILLAYVVWRTGSIWTGVIVHGLNNFISAMFLLLR